MENTYITGSCFCRVAEYRILNKQGLFQYCHCSRCRKFTGSAFGSNIILKSEYFSWIKGEKFIKEYVPEETKYFKTAFCHRCGSSMPWTNKTGKVVVIPAGTLDQDPGIKPVQNVFCNSAASWYEFPENLPQHATLPSRQ